MNLKKVIKIASVSIVALAVAAAAVFYIKYTELFNCFTVNDSDEFRELNNNIYISKDTPKKVQDSILTVLEEADKRVCTFWNADKKTKDPVIIFCYSKSLLSDYSKKNSIVTYKTPLNSFIVFYKDCINTDMLSHELFHAEFCSRIGYFKNKNIPAWFDEGLAMQVDYRKEYSVEKYNQLRDSLGMNINLSKISAPEKFYSGNYYLHFVSAGHEVTSWFNKVKRKGLYDLINRISSGENFYFVYEELKAKYSF